MIVVGKPTDKLATSYHIISASLSNVLKLLLTFLFLSFANFSQCGTSDRIFRLLSAIQLHKMFLESVRWWISWKPLCSCKGLFGSRRQVSFLKDFLELTDLDLIAHVEFILFGWSLLTIQGSSYVLSIKNSHIDGFHLYAPMYTEIVVIIDQTVELT